MQHTILTERQRQVLWLLACGKTMKEIAFSLNVSTKTIEKYATQLHNIFNARNTISLVREAFKRGVIQFPDWINEA